MLLECVFIRNTADEKSKNLTFYVYVLERMTPLTLVVRNCV